MIAIYKKLERNGFVIVPDVIAPALVADLIKRVEAYIGCSGDSGHGMRHLVQTIPAIKAVAEDVAVRGLVEPLLGPDVLVVRSLFFDKTPDTNWKVPWHQDLTIAVQRKVETRGFTAWSMKGGVAHVQPPMAILERMLTVRLHLDDCAAANGPLQVIPGSHQSGRLNPEEISQWRNRGRPTICELSRGDVLLMRPLLLHASAPAAKPQHRRVIHLEFAAESLPGELRWLET